MSREVPKDATPETEAIEAPWKPNQYPGWLVAWVCVAAIVASLGGALASTARMMLGGGGGSNVLGATWYDVGVSVLGLFVFGGAALGLIIYLIGSAMASNADRKSLEGLAFRRFLLQVGVPTSVCSLLVAASVILPIGEGGNVSSQYFPIWLALNLGLVASSRFAGVQPGRRGTSRIWVGAGFAALSFLGLMCHAYFGGDTILSEVGLDAGERYAAGIGIPAASFFVPLFLLNTFLLIPWKDGVQSRQHAPTEDRDGGERSAVRFEVQP